jgi:hypothetical protein
VSIVTRKLEVTQNLQPLQVHASETRALKNLRPIAPSIDPNPRSIRDVLPPSFASKQVHVLLRKLNVLGR